MFDMVRNELRRLHCKGVTKIPQTGMNIRILVKFWMKQSEKLLNTAKRAYAPDYEGIPIRDRRYHRLNESAR
jgi:hypothetical protein